MAITVNDKNLGHATAYGYAVGKGYLGTEDEFAELMASYATVAESASASAETASEKASQASQALADAVSAKNDAVSAKNDAMSAKTSAESSASSASQSASSASASASTASTASTTATAKATEAAASATSASGSATAAQTAKTAAETAQTAAELAQSAAEIAQGKAEDAAESINPDTLAKIDGYYAEMTVGNAEQLVATVGEEDSTPYNFRTSGGSIDIGDRETDMVIGGTIAFNQFCTGVASTMTDKGITRVSNGDGSFTISGTSTALGSMALQSVSNADGNLIQNHVYYLRTLPTQWVTSTDAMPYGGIAGLRVDLGNGGLYKHTLSFTASAVRIDFVAGVTFDNCVIFPQWIDLTKMFGLAIADYVYNLETANAGAGVAWFKKLFPKDHYAYNTGELMSVKTSAHKMVGFNAFDAESGIAKLVGGMQYQITGTYTSLSFDGVTITPDSSGYFTPPTSGTMTVTGGGSNTCIHLVWDGERDGEYEEYVEHVYPLDSSLELRGIPKLDSANNLYYDGDTYESDGTVTRKFFIKTLSSANNVALHSSNVYYTTFNLTPNTGTVTPTGATDTRNAILSNGYICGQSLAQGYFYITSGGNTLAVVFEDQTMTTVEAVNAYLANNPLTIIYELATPASETAEPYQNPQIVNNFGTEEYVDARAIPIPVGHETTYMANLRAKLEMFPDSPSADGEYIVKQTNGQNEYTTLASSATMQSILEKLPSAPSEDGTYTLTVTVSNGTATYSWGANS